MSAHWEKIQALDNIEKDIITCIQSAGQALQELSKDKSNLKQAEGQTNQFLKTLNSVESRLHDQINYLTQVSTGQPHEGSGYASQKVLQMAWHRLEHVRSRVNELDNLKNTQIAEVAVRAPSLAIGMGIGPNVNAMPPQSHTQILPPNSADAQNN
ncbi:hypothetical protein ONE63_010999 [Megalurothrips usitatus]|uniref:Mediator of RNA polymerase II transcription subunit 11 n=1 Tax=Megalurothrips usitatus TaxID=439358 RepID=A0AAV7XLA0_9NEOP|nr:hypothetical protein ONE63_010999 [Megalurothrips usitatus]